MRVADRPQEQHEREDVGHDGALGRMADQEWVAGYCNEPAQLTEKLEEGHDRQGMHYRAVERASTRDEFTRSFVIGIRHRSFHPGTWTPISLAYSSVL